MALPDPDLLARLVAFDTTSCNSNLPLAEFLADYLDGGARRVELHPSADGSKTNLLAWAGPEPDGSRRGLLLSGHMDVVPAEEPGWTSDPFTLTDRGDRWVARGACDMKGFLALAANLARETEASRLTAPLALLFTYDEEVGTLGAKRFVETFSEPSALPKNAVIGEPTSLAVARAHKGHFKVRVTLRGRAAHSGYPHLGENAIVPAARVVSALAAVGEVLEQEVAPHRELFPEVPYVPLNVGRIQGGSAINVVPERCCVELGVRPLPGMASTPLVERVSAAARRAAAPGVPEIELLSDSPSLLLDEDAPVYQVLCGAVGQRSSATVSFATDAGWLQQLGLDCAIFGPGSIEHAHRPDEDVPKSELAAARDILRRTIAAFCGDGER